jgi:DNA-binding NarL/FixJ family response regulator
MTDQIHIGIVDDDALIVNLLKDFVDNQQDMTVVLTAENGQDCLDKLKQLETLPDVLLMDLKMDNLNGIETTELLKKRFPSIKTVIVSSHYKLSFMGFMIKTGVCAFAPKGISTSELLNIIHEVHERGYYFNSDQMETIRDQLSSKFPKPKLDENQSLSERELDVLKLLCQQKTAKEIGEKLFITKRTVEGHKNNLFLKTGAKNVAGLVLYAVQNRLIDPTSLPII